jgi:hypothetical protein
VAARLPVLSAYLGHSSPEATYWYLQATPELLALAAGRLEPLAGISPEAITWQGGPHDRARADLAGILH